MANWRYLLWLLSIKVICFQSILDANTTVSAFLTISWTMGRFCYGPPYKLYFTICDQEKLLTSSLLIPHLRDSTLNEPSLNKTFESEKMFHLSRTISTHYSQNIVLYNDLEELLNYLLIMPHL